MEVACIYEILWRIDVAIWCQKLAARIVFDSIAVVTTINTKHLVLEVVELDLLID